MPVGEAVKAQSRLLGLSRKSSGAQDRTWISTKGFCLQLWRKLGKVSDKHREVDGCGGSIASPHIKPKIPMQTPPLPPQKYQIHHFRQSFIQDCVHSRSVLRPLGRLDQHNNGIFYAAD